MCDKKIKLWDKDDGEFQCVLTRSHNRHIAQGLFTHQTIEWQDGDRRQFEGEFVRCSFPNCVLPLQHNSRNHAF